MHIDLRSDTATRPTPGMLQAMMNAKVGDDVFGEDLSIIELQNKTAELFGMEAGLFCPSGTMTNQIAIKTHTQPGDELICDSNAHIYNYEGGGIAFNSGVQAKLLQGDRGRITAEQIAEQINPGFDWLAKTSLVSIENTSNRSGGSVYDLEEIKKIAALCKQQKLKFHLDGARIFNALIETKCPEKLTGMDKINFLAKENGKCFDSISVCFSKGLGTPVGSVLLGTNEFINRARRIRKVFGGGMRQAGFLAAAGTYALEHHILRLKEDHRRAAILATELQKLPYVESILPADTNIVIFTLKDSFSADDFVSTLKKNNIVCSGFGKQKIRFVTHLDFTDEMLEQTLRLLKKIAP
jgi:threonine aldolase